MLVRAHRLFGDGGNPVRIEPTPNQGGAIRPRFLVVHYTGDVSLEGAVAWLRNPEARASAHLVIGRDGQVVQMAPFDRRAWHAGRSAWGGLTGINAHSIGIELVNAGKLRRAGEGWAAPLSGRPVADADCMRATHAHEHAPAMWQRFPEAQLEALRAAARALHAAYRFEAILGHDDIAPGRKLDPGPAFPMAAFRAELIGRAA